MMNTCAKAEYCIITEGNKQNKNNTLALLNIHVKISNEECECSIDSEIISVLADGNTCTVSLSEDIFE